MKYDYNFHLPLSNEQVFKDIQDEQNHIGYYKLPFQDTKEINEYAKTVKQKDIAVVGIGGSTLGTFAIYDFLRRSRKYTKELHFFESTDPIDLKARVEKLNLDDTLFIIISKSGTTVETISTLKYLHTKTTIDKNNCVVVTEDDSKLNKYAKSNGMKTFTIPKAVGGRFSVFSPVGLLPLAIIGVKIDELLNGCKEVYNSFFNKEFFYEPIMTKARFIAEYKHKFNINVIFSYATELEGFNKWYVQLWGESLGKIDIDKTNQGLTPIGILGPVDQHSFLQLIVEGRRDKTVTFIKVEDFEDEAKIPDISLEGLEELDYLNGLKFKELINHQADSTIKAVQDLEDIPCDVITILKVDEYNLAKLMFGYELLTSVVAKFLYIDAYDQPGVEIGKIILKDKLKQHNKDL